MSINKFNRKFKRTLASSLLGALCCSLNTIQANYEGSALHGVSQFDRGTVWFEVKSENEKTNESMYLMSGKVPYSYKWITNTICLDGNEFIALNYKYGKMTNFDRIIFVKDKMGKYSAVPYDKTIIELLPKYYNKLGNDYKLPLNENKWWDQTQECIDHLKALDLDSKTNKTDKNEDDKARRNNDTFIDDIARYLGLSRWQTIGLILGGGIVIIGGTVWILKSLLSSVGKAGSDIIHGSNDKNSEKQFVQIPIASSLAPAPAPIIINNK